METLEIFSFYSAFPGYWIAFGLYLAYGLTRRERLSRLGHGVLGAAVALHGLSLAFRAIAARSLPGHGGYFPWGNWFESFSLFAFLIAAAFLIVQAKSRMPILGVFVLPWACLALGAAFAQAISAARGFGMTGFAELCALAKSVRAFSPAQPALPTSWMTVHVPLVFASYAAFANAFGVGLAYLVQEHQLKSRKPGELCYRLPPLEDMDRLIFGLIAAAFPLLTAGLALGAGWAHTAWGRAWGWDPKEVWSLITWLIYLFYLTARFGAGWRGRRTAYLSLAGFAVVLFTYVGVNYLSRTHGFLGGH
jgi:cytochrome c-type biogenesis protein CcsB